MPECHASGAVLAEARSAIGVAHAPITSETFHAWRPSRRVSRPRTGPALGSRDCDVHRADEPSCRRSSPTCRRRSRLLPAFHVASPALRTRLPPDAVGRAAVGRREWLRRTDTAFEHPLR